MPLARRVRGDAPDASTVCEVVDPPDHLVAGVDPELLSQQQVCHVEVEAAQTGIPARALSQAIGKATTGKQRRAHGWDELLGLAKHLL